MNFDFFLFCLIKRYAAPICVDVEYTHGSRDDPRLHRRVFEHYCNLIMMKICVINFSFVFFFLAQCWNWKNAYYAAELLLCLIWERWSWTC